MSKKLGLFCLLLGVCCLISAVGLLVHNHLEENRADNASGSLLQEVQEIIITEDSQNETSVYENTVIDASKEMPVIQAEGYNCIGVLSIPVLELELPVLTDWSYAKLKIAPCHYYGTYFGSDFVIAAHNYQSHFGRLPQLQPKDLVLFTDVSGTTHCYEVVLIETLPGNATEEMITSGFDLSLYTCTSGGSNRVTVRCNAVK
jgi:sortase A